MPRTSFRAPTPRARRSVLAGALVAILVAGCGVVSTTPPAPTPADFPGIASVLSQGGIVLDDWVAGDAGCPDAVLTPTAIAFDASGLDQTTVVRIYLYIFRNREAFERLRQTVDACARSYVHDPEGYETIEESPFVMAAQGPWAPMFEAALRAGLRTAAGTGG